MIICHTSLALFVLNDFRFLLFEFYFLLLKLLKTCGSIFEKKINNVNTLQEQFSANLLSFDYHNVLHYVALVYKLYVNIDNVI